MRSTRIAARTTLRSTRSVYQEGLRKSMAHTPGPWFWEINPSTHSVGLFSAKGMKNTVIGLRRWGSQGATMWIVDLERPGFIKPIHQTAIPFQGREHHASW